MFLEDTSSYGNGLIVGGLCYLYASYSACLMNVPSCCLMRNLFGITLVLSSYFFHLASCICELSTNFECYVFANNLVDH